MTATKHPAEALADEWASDVARHAVEDLYGGSRAYTAECKRDADESRAALMAHLRRIPALEAEIGRLTAALDDAQAEASVAQMAVEALRSEISDAIGTTRYMDPPDGGDVSLAEQVWRMRREADCAVDWLDRTEWTQEEYSRGLLPGAAGKHRADLMRDEIERLRSKIDALQKALRMWMSIQETPFDLAGLYGKAMENAVEAQCVIVDEAYIASIKALED